MRCSLNRLYQVVGISKQGVHQYTRRQKAFNADFSSLWAEVDTLRDEHPGCGLEKMYDTLKPSLMGRDRFCSAFMELGYRVRRVKNYHRTTIPSHIQYPNMIEGMTLSNTNMVWQSDITYYRLKEKFYYITFITDVYSRKIVGYNVSSNLRASASIEALKMALKDHSAPQIHHSDRGVQYVSKGYTNLLNKAEVVISMGLKGQDNAYAERVNGTIKNEYLKKWSISTEDQLKIALSKAVNHYNRERIHRSLPGKQSPVSFEKTKEEWNKLEIIHAPNRLLPDESTFIWKKNYQNKLVCSTLN